MTTCTKKPVKMPTAPIGKEPYHQIIHTVPTVPIGKEPYHQIIQSTCTKPQALLENLGERAAARDACSEPGSSLRDLTSAYKSYGLGFRVLGVRCLGV